MLRDFKTKFLMYLVAESEYSALLELCFVAKRTHTGVGLDYSYEKAYVLGPILI